MNQVKRGIGSGWERLGTS